MASIRFFKLFDMLARMGYKKTDLKTEIGLSSTTIAKLSKGESVTTDTILRICERFDVQPGDPGLMRAVSLFRTEASRASRDCGCSQSLPQR